LKLPADLNVTDGTEASIQVITVGDAGASLYNCADITFKADAKPLSGDSCKSNNVTFATVKQQGASSAGSAAGMSSVVLSSVVGLALIFVCGMSL